MESTFCIASSRSQAEAVIFCLKADGFRCGDLSVLAPDSFHRKSEESTFKGESVIGGAFGWVEDAGKLAVPQLGRFVVAGPLHRALRLEPSSDLLHVLATFGLPDSEARSLYKAIGRGGIILAAHSDSRELLDRANQVFDNAGCQYLWISFQSLAGFESSNPFTGVPL